MTLHLSIVADVFREAYQAKNAIEALRRAGFAYDQIGIAMRGHEGIDLQSDLQNLGVSHEDASFYAQEVKAGYTVLSVRPDGREQEAHEIMRRSGAFTDAESAAAHQAASTEHHIADMQDDFHQPRSLKPREERVPVSTQYIQAEEAQMRPALVTEQKPGAIAPVEQDEDTEKRPRGAPVVENVEVIQQEPDVAPVIQNDQVDKQLPLVEEEHRETTSIGGEEELLYLTSRAETLPIQIQPEKYGNRTLIKNGVLLGGSLLGLGTAVLLVLLRREQIRLFVLSTGRLIKTQLASITKRGHEGRAALTQSSRN